MSTIRILAVEDDPIIAETIEVLVEELGYELIEVVDNGQEALRMHKAARPDLVLIDIKIKGGIDGIEVAYRMNQHSPTPVIFITSMKDPEIFRQAKEVVPLAYVTKPFDETSLQYAIELAVSRIADKKQEDLYSGDILNEDKFFIKDKNHLTKVDFSEILWVEVEGKYIQIKTKDRKLEVRIALKDLERKLPRKSFMRIHRKYLINLDIIKDVDLEKGIVKTEDEELPLGVNFRESFMKRLNLL